MSEYLIQDTTLDAIADAINAKTGGSSAMTPAQMVTAIGNISTSNGIEFTLTNAYSSIATLRSAIQSVTGLTNFLVRSRDTAPNSGYFLYGGVYIPNMSGYRISSTSRRTSEDSIGSGSWESGSVTIAAGSNWIAWEVGDYE